MAARYREALASLAAKTRTPLSSLVVSFGILHEATALVPLVALFYASRSLGLGERAVAALPPPQSGTWASQKLRTWVDDGERWAGRVGSRYGVFGMEKGGKPEPRLGALAGDVANAVVAYAATKALLPVRIGAAMYLSPAFARTAIDPARAALARLFRRGK
ncbi:hypothetical protein C8J57DRAFT_1283163 [Mycena rebaudengoi]|nr:hypothetical protein C8J57DRAFT_1283163 [Mycena rebaudengoi]